MMFFAVGERAREPGDRIRIEVPGYGEVLRELREHAKRTKGEAAKRCLVNYNTIWYWENEDRVPYLDSFIAAVKAYGYHMEIVKDRKE